jgi:8-oxo-dGTP pyrophosphatase MutT (NUDIX family)
MVYEKSCGAIVFKKNSKLEYLLLHYESGHWGFVKGNIESNESEKETVLRELKEETGIVNAEFIGNFRETIKYSYRRRGTIVNKEVVYYLIQAQNVNVELSHEHDGYEWADYYRALEKLTFKNSRKLISKANESLKDD